MEKYIFLNVLSPRKGTIVPELISRFGLHELQLFQQHPQVYLSPVRIPPPTPHGHDVVPIP